MGKVGVSKQEYWARHVGEYRRSGLSQGAYCRRHGLSKSSLGYWCGKLARETVLGARRQDDDAGAVVIVPLTWEAAPEAMETRPVQALPLRVLIGGRYAVHIDGDFAPEVLGKLVRTLEAL